MVLNKYIPHGNAPKNGKTIYFCNFLDKREDRTRIGIVSNIWCMETADVYSRNEVCIWLSNCLEAELIYLFSMPFPYFFTANIV